MATTDSDRHALHMTTLAELLLQLRPTRTQPSIATLRDNLLTMAQRSTITISWRQGTPS